MIPYKNRQISYTQNTWCYRNLNRGGYSMVQGNRVVAHTDSVTVIDASFVVREGGRQRVLRESRKNVHAFVVGRVPEVVMINGLSASDWRRARYNPRRGAHFEVEMDGPWVPLRGARAAILDENGMTVYEPQLL